MGFGILLTPFMSHNLFIFSNKDTVSSNTNLQNILDVSNHDWLEWVEIFVCHIGPGF